MASTYLDLTNRLLRRVNDVEIEESDFASARGIQGTAKDCILDTVREINLHRIDWPFNAVEHTELLIAGTQEYAWPTTFTFADWQSFQIQSDDDLDVGSTSLMLINREDWYHMYRDTDYNAGTAGIGVPKYVFPSHGQGWGVTPSPDAAYTVKFRYFKTPTDLSAFDDECNIPSKFDYVIIAGALMHMNLFKENPDGTAIMQRKFEMALKDMISAYFPNQSRLVDGRINLGGGNNTGGYLYYKGGL